VRDGDLEDPRGAELEEFWTLNVVDPFSRKGLASEMDTPGARVIQVLDHLAQTVAF
jgi:hypothetical protein